MSENEKENKILDCVTESIRICKNTPIIPTSSAKPINLQQLSWKTGDSYSTISILNLINRPVTDAVAST